VRFGGDQGVNCQKLALAVSEAVSNAVAHAYSDQPDEAVYVEAVVDGSAVVVTVRDRGIGMRPYPNPKEGGFGLPLIKKAADQVAISSSESGMSIQMRFARFARR
jgi:anti-sigma regulatory factor (Ser/Thr protein kinase)